MSDKYRRTLLEDAEKIEITWRFDEQQADPIHRNNFVDGLKKEIEQSVDLMPANYRDEINLSVALQDFRNTKGEIRAVNQLNYILNNIGLCIAKKSTV